MKKALTLVLEDAEIIELIRILPVLAVRLGMDDDEAAALAFLKDALQGQSPRVARSC